MTVHLWSHDALAATLGLLVVQWARFRKQRSRNQDVHVPTTAPLKRTPHHSHTHTRTRTHTHAHARTRTRTRTHTQSHTESDLLRLHEVPPLDAGYEQRVRGSQHGRHQPAMGTSARALLPLGPPTSTSSSSSSSSTWTRTQPARTMNT